jgi:hypothetical protein
MTTSTPNFVLHPSATAPGEGIWYATPAGFTALPLESLLASPSSAAADDLHQALDPLLASTPDEATRQAVLANLTTAQRMFQVMRAAGTVHCSLGLHRDDTGDGDGGPLLSLFTITWVPTAWAPRAVTAARAVATAEDHTRIEYVELPSGPATFSETVRKPTPDSGLPQRPLLQVHAHIPHPDGRRLAVLTLSTTAASHREHYRAVLQQIAGLISFDDPFAPGAEERNTEPLRERG